MKVSSPTRPDLVALYEVTGPFCASIYLPTTPVSVNAGEGRLLFRNLAREALDQLRAAGAPVAFITRLESEYAGIASDSAFWSGLDHGLAVLSWDDRTELRSLSYGPQPITHVSDRLHLKPLLGETSTRAELFVLALSQHESRLIHVNATGGTHDVEVKGLPANVEEVAGQPSDVDRSMSALDGREGQKVRMQRYAHAVAAVLRPILVEHRLPLVLAAAQPLDALFRQEADYPRILAQSIPGSPEHTSSKDLATAAELLLNADRSLFAREALLDYDLKASQGTATSDVAEAVVAATSGAIHTVVANLDADVFGRADDQTGAIAWASDGSLAQNYDLVDEAIRRTLAHGGEVLAAASDAVPDQAPLAALLRFAV